MKEIFNDAGLKSQLRNMGEEVFFNEMMQVFAADATGDRMRVAIDVMEERFGRYPKAAQLTWALDTAVRNDNIPMIDFLLGEGALIDGTKKAYMPELLGSASFSPVATAISRASDKTLEHLLSLGASPNPPKNAFIYNAAYIGASAGKTSALLDAGARGGTEEAFRDVVLVSHRLDIADIILEKTGLGANMDGGSIVRSAVMALYRDMPDAGETVQFLLARGADFASAARSFETDNAHFHDAPKLAALARQIANLPPAQSRRATPASPKA